MTRIRVRQRGLTFERMVTAVLFLGIFAMAVRETVDPDMWWHLRTGETILQSGIPRYDVFSFTVPNHEWVTHEWLSQVFMWVVYRAAGLSGLIFVFAGFIALTFWLVYRCSRGRPFLAAFVTLLGGITSAIVWGARPQIFNLLFAALFIHILTHVGNKELKSWALWLLPVSMVLWANLHSGYLLGIAILVVYTVGETIAYFTDQPTAFGIRRLVIITAVSFLVTILNPSGIELWIYPFLTLGSPAMQVYIQEWHSPDFHLSMFWPFGLMIAVGAAGMLFSSERPSWTELLLFGGTAVAGLVSARNIPIFAIVTIPIITRHWVHAAAGTWVQPILNTTPSEAAPARPMLILNWIILLITLLGVGLWTATKIVGNEAAIAARYPVTAVDYIEQAGLTNARIYNDYNWGGYLIWRGLPVFVDGRADVYGDAFLFNYRRTYDVAPGWEEPLEQYDVNYILMARGSPLTVLLTVSDQWHELYADELAQLFVRVE